MPLVELANGVAVNTAHVTQMRIVDCAIVWRLVSDGEPQEVPYAPTERQKLDAAFPHIVTFDTFDEAADAYRALIDASDWGGS